MATTKKTTTKKTETKKQGSKSTALAISTPIGFLDSKKKSIEKFCAANASVTQIIRTALMAFDENWKLQKALESITGRNSVYNAMQRAASTGLSLNPLEGNAALIPYSSQNKQTGQWETTVSYQVMKNGIIKLAFDSDKIDFLSSDTIRANDEFKILKTSNGDSFEFSPALTGRGDIIGMYAGVRLKNGKCAVCYMTIEQIKEHRDSYSASYRYDLKEKTKTSPWTHSEEGMGIKTVVKRLFNNFYISDAVKRAINADNEQEGLQVIDFEPLKTSGPDDISKQLADKDASEALEQEGTIDAEGGTVSETKTDKKVGF